MLKKLNSLFFKLVLIVALVPLAPAILIVIATISPILLPIVILILFAWLVPSFRPLSFIGRLFTGIFAILGDVLGFLFGWILFGQRGARFMSFWEKWSLLNNGNNGFLVDGHSKRLSDKVSFESVLTVGGMGRGKSSNFVMPNLFTLDNCSFVVSDTSGEIYERTSGYLARKGFQVKVLNLMNPHQSDFYNPLAYANDYTKIAQTAKIIVDSQVGGNSQDVFWNLGAEKIIKIFIQCLHNQNQSQYLNLANVKHLIANYDAHTVPQGQLGRIDNFVMSATRNDPSTFNEYRSFNVGNPKTMLSFLSTADAALNAIGNPDIASLTAKSTIDFRELRKQKTVLYVLAKQQDMQYYQFLLNLFYTELFNSLLDHQPTKDELSVWLMLDEFGHLRIPQFDTFATTARKYRVGFWIFLQSISQLESRYGRNNAETIMDGLQTEIYLPGQSLSTAQELEKRLGHMQLNSKGNTRSLLSADEIIRMKDDRALLLYSNKRPVKLKLKPYYKQMGMNFKSKKQPAPLPNGVIQPVSFLRL